MTIEELEKQIQAAQTFEALTELIFKIPHVTLEFTPDYNRLVNLSADCMAKFTKDRILV